MAGGLRIHADNTAAPFHCHADTHVGESVDRSETLAEVLELMPEFRILGAQAV
jgi:hypothetical protein